MLTFTWFFLSLLSCSLAAQKTFYFPHARYRTISIQFYCRGLSTPLLTEKYIEWDNYLVGRETVYTGLTISPSAPVMGKNDSGYCLYDFLRYVSNYRGNEVVLLHFPTQEAFRSSRWSLREFNQNWMWLQVAPLKGPNGEEPTFTAAQLNEEYGLEQATRCWIAYQFTTKPDKPFGYTAAHMTALKGVAFKGNLTGIGGLLLLDILHASNSPDLPDEFMKKRMKAVILEETPGTNPSLINFPGINTFIKKFGVDKVYLDVRPTVRNTILEKFAPEEEKKKNFWAIDKGGRTAGHWVILLVSVISCNILS